MDSQATSFEAYWQAAALLEWQGELGATEAISDVPVNRYDLPDTLAKATPARVSAPSVQRSTATVAAVPGDAARLAAGAGTLEDLRAVMAGFEGCELKKGARNLVFSDGDPGARVMIVGEAPGREEDARGLPFVGREGQLLDRMFDAIDMGRTISGAHGLYITNILPWQPPGNRDPNPEEIATMLPFVHRHIELADPEVLVLMGNISCQALLGRKGITRLRGTWTTVSERPALPMFHPSYLLRNPIAKRDAWHDLLTLRKRLST